MSKHCPHALHSTHYDDLDCEPPLVRVTSRCFRCGVWLPLGPSDETPVDVEVRAADLSNLARSHATTSESHGWEICRRDADMPPGLEDDVEYLAGYLARVIFEHADTSLPADLLPDALAVAMRAPRIR